MKTRMIVACGLWALGQAALAQTLDVVDIAVGLVQPLEVTFAPGDPDRIFIVEQPGRIRVKRTGEPMETFLDITDIVTIDGFDRGLLGMAFDPDYQTNGKFYVHYTREQLGQDPVIIASYTVSGDPDRADPNSAVTVMEIEQLGVNHHGGWIEFGPNDGMLYFSLGTNGDFSNGQDTSNLLGTLVRIDPRGDDFPNDDLKNYAVPPDNPFVGVQGAAPEIWVYGLRHPWRASFDAATGDIYIGDVGEQSIEEIDFVSGTSPGGENFGWDCFEGSQETGRCLDLPVNHVAPIHEFTQEDNRCAVTGGRVYRGCAIPELDGTYFFLDFCTSTYWTFRYDGAQITDFMDRSVELMGNGRVTSFGVDYHGELYLCIFGGIIRKIIPADPPPDSDGDGIPDSCEGCAADLDGDEDADADDFFAYLDAFASGDFGVCDIDGDEDCDADDFFGYLDLFAQGC